MKIEIVIVIEPDGASHSTKAAVDKRAPGFGYEKRCVKGCGRDVDRLAAVKL